MLWRQDALSSPHKQGLLSLQALHLFLYHIKSSRSPYIRKWLQFSCSGFPAICCLIPCVLRHDNHSDSCPKGDDEGQSALRILMGFLYHTRREKKKQQGGKESQFPLVAMSSFAKVPCATRNQNNPPWNETGGGITPTRQKFCLGRSPGVPNSVGRGNVFSDGSVGYHTFWLHQILRGGTFTFKCFLCKSRSSRSLMDQELWAASLGSSLLVTPFSY